MKNWTLRFRAVDKKNFDELKSGVKSIETRAGTVKYQPVEVGDTLTFVCGQERCVKKVAKRYHWPSIDAMVKDIDFKKVMPSVGSVAEMEKTYASYPDYEKKIKEHGLLGFELGV
jgi:ASC-1-like (ASCH) protein